MNSVIQKPAAKLYQEVLQSAETIKSGAEIVFPRAASPGDYMRQGDVYITLLDKLPNSAVLVGKPSPQVAEGNTQGARHIMNSLDGVKVFKKSDASVIDGPILDFRGISSTETRTLTHPQHGDVVMPCGEGMIFEITFQISHAEVLKRAKD